MRTAVGLSLPCSLRSAWSRCGGGCRREGGKGQPLRFRAGCCLAVSVSQGVSLATSPRVQIEKLICGHVNVAEAEAGGGSEWKGVREGPGGGGSIL